MNDFEKQVYEVTYLFLKVVGGSGYLYMQRVIQSVSIKLSI